MTSSEGLPETPSFRVALRFWAWLGFVSFGGPAGQIAIMHREVVERRRWLGDSAFMHALNFCMLLPGPEALQLAIYLGWRMHGVKGGVVAGVLFILPAMSLLLGLSFVYAAYGELPAIAAALLGLKATVIALILHALLRLGRRALKRGAHWLIALVALLAMLVLDAPFPLLIAAAAIAGALLQHEPAPVAAAGALPTFPWATLAIGLALWALPALMAGSLAGPESLYAQVYGFFTVAAFVTFGGAYAVLAYVSQQVVEVYGWLTQAQVVAGLGLAETTPGPLVIVLQFVGYMAGWNQPGAAGPAVTAMITAMFAAWATFLPSFIFILVGAPYVERLASNVRLAGALAAVTAAVVGVIGNLAVIFGAAVLFPGGFNAPHWIAIGIAAVALLAFETSRIALPWVIVGGALAGWTLA